MYFFHCVLIVHYTLHSSQKSLVISYYVDNCKNVEISDLFLIQDTNDSLKIKVNILKPTFLDDENSCHQVIEN